MISLLRHIFSLTVTLVWTDAASDVRNPFSIVNLLALSVRLQVRFVLSFLIVLVVNTFVFVIAFQGSLFEIISFFAFKARRGSSLRVAGIWA